MKTTQLTALQAQAKEFQKNYSSKLETITPEIAQNYLDKNLDNCVTRNRSINKRNLTKIARDMKNGNWIPGASSIKFDTNDVMIDGQHTCRAIVSSETAVNCLVERGLPPEAFKVMDSGKPRTFTDVLSTLVLPNGQLIERPKVVSGSIVILHNLKKNHIHIDKNYSLTSTEICDKVLADWKYYTQPLERITKWYAKIGRRIPETWLAAFYYDKKKRYNMEVDLFLSILCNGDSNSPIIKSFREELAANKSRSDSDKRKMTPDVIMKRMDALFKYHLEGTLSTLRYFKRSDLV